MAVSTMIRCAITSAADQRFAAGRFRQDSVGSFSTAASKPARLRWSLSRIVCTGLVALPSSAIILPVETHPLLYTRAARARLAPRPQLESLAGGEGGFLVERRQVAQMLDHARQDLSHILDVLARGRPAQREAQAGAGAFGRELDGGKHMRGLDRARRAGRPGRAGNALEVEGNHQRLALHKIKINVGRVWGAAEAVAVHARVRHVRQDAALQLVAQRRDSGSLFGQLHSSALGRCAQTDNAGDVFGAGTPVTFVA